MSAKPPRTRIDLNLIDIGIDPRAGPAFTLGYCQMMDL